MLGVLIVDGTVLGAMIEALRPGVPMLMDGRWTLGICKFENLRSWGVDVVRVCC